MDPSEALVAALKQLTEQQLWLFKQMEEQRKEMEERRNEMKEYVREANRISREREYEKRMWKAVKAGETAES